LAATLKTLRVARAAHEEQGFAVGLQLSPQHVEPNQIVVTHRRQIKQQQVKPKAWLGETQSSDEVAAAEQGFLKLALQT
jgi:hypothetical protein